MRSGVAGLFVQARVPVATSMAGGRAEPRSHWTSPWMSKFAPRKGNAGALSSVPTESDQSVIRSSCSGRSHLSELIPSLRWSVYSPLFFVVRYWTTKSAPAIPLRGANLLTTVTFQMERGSALPRH